MRIICQWRLLSMLLLQLLFDRPHNFESIYFINFRYFLKIDHLSLSRESVALQLQRLSESGDIGQIKSIYFDSGEPIKLTAQAHLPVPLIPDGRIRASYFPCPRIWSNTFFSFSRKFIFALFALKENQNCVRFQMKRGDDKSKPNKWTHRKGKKKTKMSSQFIKENTETIELVSLLTAMHCISMPGERARSNEAFSFSVWTSSSKDSSLFGRQAFFFIPFFHSISADTT